MPFDLDQKAQTPNRAPSFAGGPQGATSATDVGLNGHGGATPRESTDQTYGSGLRATIAQQTRHAAAAAEQGKAARERLEQLEELRQILNRNPELRRALELMFELGLR